MTPPAASRRSAVLDDLRHLERARDGFDVELTPDQTLLILGCIFSLCLILDALRV